MGGVKNCGETKQIHGLKTTQKMRREDRNPSFPKNGPEKNLVWNVALKVNLPRLDESWRHFSIQLKAGF